VRLVVDPHVGRVVGVEDEAGASLGATTEFDQIANQRRARRKPDAGATPDSPPGPRTGPNLVEIALAKHHGRDHVKKVD